MTTESTVTVQFLDSHAIDSLEERHPIIGANDHGYWLVRHPKSGDVFLLECSSVWARKPAGPLPEILGWTITVAVGPLEDEEIIDLESGRLFGRFTVENANVSAYFEAGWACAQQWDWIMQVLP